MVQPESVVVASRLRLEGRVRRAERRGIECSSHQRLNKKAVGQLPGRNGETCVGVVEETVAVAAWSCEGIRVQ